MADLNVAVKIAGDATSLSKAADEGAAKLGGLGKAAQVASTALGVALGGGLAMLPGKLMEFAKAAGADEQATARLDKAIENLGGNFADIKGQVNAAIVSGQKLAFTDDDVRDSFVLLAAAGGDANEALIKQKAAMDLARGANIPLMMATKMLGKLTDENIQVFSRLGIRMEKGASEAEVLAAVQAKFAGQSEAYAQSTAGQFEQAQIALHEVGESIGYAVLPALTAVGRVLADNLPAIQDFVGGLSTGFTTIVMPALQETTNVVKTFLGAISGDWQPAAGISALPMLAGQIGLALRDLAAIAQKALGGDLKGAILDMLGVAGAARLQLVDTVLGWGRALIEWIVPLVPSLLANLSSFLQEALAFIATNTATLIEHLASWAASMIDWIAPQMPALLRELGGFLAGMTVWLIDIGLPAILAKLGEWGAAFIGWVAPRILPLLGELFNLNKEVYTWIATVALPLIIEKLKLWGAAFLDWIVQEVLPTLPDKLKAIVDAVVPWVGKQTDELGKAVLLWGGVFLNWIAKDVAPFLAGKLSEIWTVIQKWIGEQKDKLLTEAGKLGGWIIDGIMSGINDAKQRLFQALRDLAGNALQAAKDALLAHSPSKLFADEVGLPIVQGIVIGIEQGMPDLLAAIGDIFKPVEEVLIIGLEVVAETIRGTVVPAFQELIKDNLKPGAQNMEVMRMAVDQLTADLKALAGQIIGMPRMPNLGIPGSGPGLPSPGLPPIDWPIGPGPDLPAGPGTARLLRGGDTYVYNVTVNVPRWVNDADSIVDDIHNALLRKRQRVASLGLT